MPVQSAAVSPQRQNWSSRLKFSMVAIGSAVGLGNLWRFPFEAGNNGGGAFVFVYLLCVAAIGLPVLVTELTIGRMGNASASRSITLLTQSMGASRLWALGGWIGIVAAFAILSFYSVVAGWIIAYLPEVLSGRFVGISAADAAAGLNALFADPIRLTIFHALFMALTVWIVAGGVRSGIERAAAWLMPAFAVMLALLTVTSMIVGDIAAALKFLFVPDFSAINADVVISAMGQAFFSLSLGAAAMITYGSYLSKDIKIPRSCVPIAICDTAVALIAGLAIFPIVFGFGLDPGAGPGLLFVTLPVAFGQMSPVLGIAFGTVFFLLALFAAVTSSISLLEASVAWMLERTSFTRPLVTSMLGLAAFIVGMSCVLSLNLWSDIHPLDAIPLFADKGFLDVLDTLTANLLMPLSGVLCAVFVGWVVTRHCSASEFGFDSSAFYRIWVLLIRWVCPLAIGIVLLFGLF